MLVLLRLRDFALVETAELELGPGLTAITGETGAGKSLIVGALQLLIGGRASSRWVRSGADSAEVEAQFESVDNPSAIEALQERGLWRDDGLLVARRTVPTRGSSRCYLNGRLCTASDLAAAVGPLVDLCGQHQHARLLDPHRQALILDRFAGAAPLAERCAVAFRAWSDATGKLKRWTVEAEQRHQRRDFLAFCAAELKDAAVTGGETEELQRRAKALHAADDLLSVAAEATSMLSSEGGLRDRLAGIAARLSRASGWDENLQTLASQADELVQLADELAADIERYSDGIDADPGRRDEVDERLSELHRLTRKYGGSEEALLLRQAEIDRELQAEESDQAELGTLQLEVPRLLQALEQAATALTAARQDAAPRLSEAAGAVLQALAMPEALLVARLDPLPNVGPGGAERVVLCLRTNRGGPTLPLKEIASGGELSRALLALERACADPSPSSTAVYDEIDAGIGGETGKLLGHHLREMASLQQIVCVTHLPQVAAAAARQLHVHKRAEGERTVSEVTLVHGAARREELARMLGSGSDATALAHADALLNG